MAGRQASGHLSSLWGCRQTSRAQSIPRPPTVPSGAYGPSVCHLRANGLSATTEPWGQDIVPLLRRDVCPWTGCFQRFRTASRTVRDARNGKPCPAASRCRPWHNNPRAEPPRIALWPACLLGPSESGNPSCASWESSLSKLLWKQGHGPRPMLDGRRTKLFCARRTC